MEKDFKQLIELDFRGDTGLYVNASGQLMDPRTKSEVLGVYWPDIINLN